MQKRKPGIVDFFELGANAFVSGLAAAIAFSVIALVLATSARAATPNGQQTGTLLVRSSDAADYALAPKLETEVAIRITGMIARTRLTQLFENPGDDPVEGIYVFPLPESAAIDHLWLRVGERVIEGRIQEKEEARRTYAQAKRQGRKSALMEQQRPNLFTNAIAHIGAKERVAVTIEYQQTLAYDGGRYRMRFPLAVTPRYMAAAAIDTGAIPDVPKTDEALADDSPVVNPAYADGCGGPTNAVDIAVVIDSGVPVDGVVSSYHDIQVEKESGNRTVVYLTKAQEEADHDFELTWSVATAASPQAALFTEKGKDGEYGLVMVMPPQPSAADLKAMTGIAREMILVIDTSGSMTGDSIEQAKAAVIQALEALTPRDRFNVLEFNSVTRTFSKVTLPASPDNVARAKAWVAKLVANGGTEMAPALTFALDGTETPGVLRQVIFMTDGGVGNEEALFRLIAARLGGSRLFTVGIGSAPNGHFMTRAAELGRGTYTYIGDVREVGEKMTRLFAKIQAPVLQDVSIRWADGSAVETFPARVPDLYLGEPIVVSASAADFTRAIVVSGTRANQPWSVALTPAMKSDGEDASGVGALWARAKIASLMDQITRGGDAAALRPAVLKVALDHHLVSPFTSLVAVDVTPTARGRGTSRDGEAEAKVALVRASLPRGYTGALPQTDTPATLQLLLGIFALGTAAIVFTVGRR
jgi:Ca-activated chloride channel family protein